MLSAVSCRLWVYARRSYKPHNSGMAKASWSWCVELECEYNTASVRIDQSFYFSHTALHFCHWPFFCSALIHEFTYSNHTMLVQFVSVSILDRMCSATLTLIIWTFVRHGESSNFSDLRHDGADDCSFILLNSLDFCSDFGKKKY